MNIRLTISLIATVFIFLGCKSDGDIGINYSQFYPLKLNEYSIYKVTEEIYVAGNNEPEINSYYEKHVVNDLFTDRSGVLTATVSIYNSPQNTGIDNWKESSIYFVEQRLGEILIIKDGLPKTILKYPIRVNNSWNINDFNENENQTAIIKEVGKSLTVNDKTWENVVKVQQREKSTLIDFYDTALYFAPSKGLVCEIDSALEYCQDNHCLGEYMIESGYKIERILIE